MATLTPVDLVSAYPWTRAAFTTYALSLSFFEVVLLDALVRGGGREALILSDVKGVRAALSEQGARRAGKDYAVEPIAVAGGVFHPKVSALTSAGDAHLLVGSGNLTFGGWGVNLEVVEHLHPSFAADAFEDAAGFFDRMQTAAHLKHAAGDQCAAIAGDLRSAARAHARNGDIRLFHSLDGAISQKIAQAVGDLGGAKQLAVVAPFFDNGPALDRLCELLGLGEAFVHAHPGGTVEGNVGSNWPTRARGNVHAIRLEVFEEPKLRRLHAKTIEVMCKRGRVLLSGSANITWAALHGEHNVEACVVRIQRERSVGWRFSNADPPEPRVALDEDANDRPEEAGVLRAILEGDKISGRILTPDMSGPASIFQLTTEGPEALAHTLINQDGAFQACTPTLEVQSWKSGRLVIRVEETASGRRAEGFVSVSTFAEIMRRAGPIGPKLLAVLAGTETPADVAAVMSWFYEDPRRLLDARSGAIGTSGVGREPGHDPIIAVSELTMNYAAGVGGGVALDQNNAAAWSRFLEHILAAFRERRGPFGRTAAGHAGEDDEDNGAPMSAGPAPEDREVERSFSRFEQLLDLMLSPENAGRHAMIAFDITQYICERLQPSPTTAKAWLDRVVRALVRAKPLTDRRSDAAAAILMLMSAKPDPESDRIARSRLLHIGADLTGEPPATVGVQGFQLVVPPSVDFVKLWGRVTTIRTFPEQVKSYLRALEARKPSAGYEDLPRDAPNEWRTLEEAFTSDAERSRILFVDGVNAACPRCHMALPTGEAQNLERRCIATAKNCCGRVIIRRPD